MRCWEPPQIHEQELLQLLALLEGEPTLIQEWELWQPLALLQWEPTLIQPLALLEWEPTQIHEYELLQLLTRPRSSQRSNGSPGLSDDA